MARLRISAVVPAPQEQVYQDVTAYGLQGLTDQAAFRDKHGELLEQTGNIIVTKDGQGDDAITWRCTFEPPILRRMEAVGSTWADRTDTFQEVRRGTRWTIVFETNRQGAVGAMQWLFFHLVTKGRLRRATVDPVLRRFRQSPSAGP